MKGIAAAKVIAIAVMAASFAPTTADAVSSMDNYLWESRPLVVFAPDERHPILSAQSEALKNQSDALRERDMVFIEVIGPTTRVDGFDVPDLDAGVLRRRYGVATGEAAALLVGKDGGVKLRQPHAFEASTLFETIDAMPMRRHEMRTRAKGSE